jgi:hypothetical protein
MAGLQCMLDLTKLSLLNENTQQEQQKTDTMKVCREKTTKHLSAHLIRGNGVIVR